MNRLFGTLAALILTATLSSCASSDGQADKETHVIPQQTTGAITLTLPAGTTAESLSALKVPLVQIKQSMTVSDSALKGGSQTAPGGTSEQTTKPETSLDLDAPVSGPDIPSIPGLPDNPDTPDKPTLPIDPDPDPDPTVPEYTKRFHHTTTGSSDGGKSLVMCPGDKVIYDSCSSAGVNIPYHGLDTGRIVYWNMNAVPRGDILCKKDGVTYRYQADSMMVMGSC